MSDPAAWGIEAGYHDVRGEWHPAAPDVVAAVLEAMGADGRPAPPPGETEVWVVGQDEPVACWGPWSLTLEDGSRLDGSDRLPALPLGYHALFRAAAQPASAPAPVRLIVTPPACHLPEGLRVWGWAAQLPSLRSGRSWGLGDLADLEELGRWSASLGAGVVQLNPLHAPLPGTTQEASPYFASSRCFRNPLYLRVEDVPGSAGAAGLAAARRSGLALNASSRIDRDQVWQLKIPVLEEVWSRSAARRGQDPDFARFRAEQGDLLEGYATFCALAELHGRDWRSWPDRLRAPNSPAVVRLAEEQADRVTFHAWLQWLVEQQLARAGRHVGLVQDLAIGTDPAGADGWLFQDALALTVKVGAPPDEFNAGGQDWGFPPFDPWKLRTLAFEPFVRVVRAALAHAGGVRVDHVAGLFRLYWIPEGFEASEGLYVRLPWQELLAVLSLESVRAGAWVVGEDLGTVQPYVREEMARRRILSTKLVWFEAEPPPRYPEHSVGAVTTHDLPTIAGLWSRSDLDDQRACGLEPNVDAAEEMRRRLGSWLAVPDDAPVRNVIVGTHQLLGQAPSAVVLATLEDAQAVEHRPNIPGTSEEDRPNWSVALPLTLEEMTEDPLVLNVAASLNRRG